MIFTIQNINNPLKYLDNNGNLVILNGYAFIDECGHCIIIVYGENRKDNMTSYLKSDIDTLGIKYKYINI